VRLEPLTNEHLPGLAAAISDGALWELPVTFVPHPRDLPQYLDAAESAFQAQRELAFATIDTASGAIAGTTRFRCIEVAHKRVEIGATFIGKAWQRTHVNTEAKYLMFCHAFEQWKFNRVELLTDVLNTKSRTAISRLGAREEGTLRSHMVMRDGRIRDSVIFSVTSADWPLLKEALGVKIGLAA
jgi:RimJ/RimL family protein N-acetyltransferase